MTIASYSDAQAQYLANLDYDVTYDVNKGALFVAACRALVAFASQGGRDGQTAQFDLLRVENQLGQALQWLQANGVQSDAQRLNNPDVLHTDFSTFRGYRNDRFHA